MYRLIYCNIKPVNAELNPICHLLTLLGAHHILHVSKVRVKVYVYLYVKLAAIKRRSGTIPPLSGLF